jgi:hypothetical protein
MLTASVFNQPLEAAQAAQAAVGGYRRGCANPEEE